eukprot:1386997-Rhodomonas_salina.1
MFGALDFAAYSQSQTQAAQAEGYTLGQQDTAYAFYMILSPLHLSMRIPAFQCKIKALLLQTRKRMSLPCLPEDAQLNLASNFAIKPLSVAFASVWTTQSSKMILE